MPKLIWDDTAEREYEIGVDHGVLYVHNGTSYGAGVAWNGLTSVSESPEGGEPNDIYADNIKYGTLRSAEDYKGTIAAYMFPDEWYECDGSVKPTGTKGLHFSQQTRKMFGFTYRTKIGNDTQGEDYGYKLHIVYGASASPSQKDYQTINDSPDAIELSWDFSTVPVPVPGYKPLAHIVIDSTEADAGPLAALEALLYGIDTVNTPTYDQTSAYQPGDVVKKDTTYYAAKEAVSAGTWNAAKWVALDDGGPKLPTPSELITMFTSST